MGTSSRKPDIEKLKQKEDIHGLVRALENKDPEVRMSALDALGVYCVHLAKVNASLESQYAHLRSQASQNPLCIYEVGDGKQALYGILKALGDENENICLNALAFLVAIGAERNVSLSLDDWFSSSAAKLIKNRERWMDRIARSAKKFSILLQDK